ncbi:MAG TPA: hypothetical protein VHO02_09205, partial [Fibrobacteria bacterium]|nr:hypothetical protein [Fibrobacteria bacterium]
SYKLDPNGSFRGQYPHYLLKHFDFAQSYFDKVSGGRVVIRPRIFPPPVGSDSLITPLRLKDRMKAYNPALEDKSAKQKTSEFNKQRAIALMRFVSETAGKFNALDSNSNPFYIASKEAATNPSPNRHHAFLIFHAGHSRLVDGGSLGYLGANTPNDFTDFFVTKPDFIYLGDSTVKDESLLRDSLGAVVKGPSNTSDTVSQFMMLSEAASQDKINWGINGILINQLARQMGLPDLFDIVKGISQVGTFDVMDFAGYNTMQGFLPVFPSAWSRSYMGWDDPVTASPADAGTNDYSEYKIYAADQPGPGRIRALRVPINEREYLLVENRQRAAGSDSLRVWFQNRADDNDGKFRKADSVAVPYAFLDSLFLDSLCTGNGTNRCEHKDPNIKKPKGVITRVSHYDAGLPGNGLLVWHVNDWFLEGSLPNGYVNAWLGDTLRNQYKGLELVEADGVPSIGKEFTDPLGQPAFDYGTARDMLPNIYRKRKNPPKDTSWAAPETLTVVGSYGFANTNAWNDGRTHIRLQALVPASPVLAAGVSSFSGDSVRTVRDSAITVRVYWADNYSVTRAAGSRWPARTSPAGNPRAVSVVRDGQGRAHVVSAADDGLLQTYTAAGRLALAARDTVRDSAHYARVEALLASGNTRPDNAAPVNSFSDTVGMTLGSAVADDSILAVLTPRGLRLAAARADSLAAGWDTSLTPRLHGGIDTLIAFAGKVGPMVWGGRVFALDSAGALRWWTPAGTGAGSVALPTGNWQSLAGIVFGSGADSQQVIVAGASGTALRVNPSTATVTSLAPAWGASWAQDTAEAFTATVSDFDRDGNDDVLLLGSRGAAILVDRTGQALPGWPQRFPRAASFSDSLSDSLGNYLSEERTPPALTDLDRDGFPDIVFSGTNGVYAYDRRGAALPGWPFRMQPRQAVGFVYANRRMAGTVVGSTPVAITLRNAPAVLIASPDGLVYAIDSAGKSVRYSSRSVDPSITKGSGVLMSDDNDWPLTAGGLSLDSTRSPFVHIAVAALGAGDPSLIAQTAAGSLNVWTLREAQVSDWSMPGGNAGRTQRLAATSLGDTVVHATRESIEEFHLYPSPLRGGIAKLHLKLGAAASGARIRIYDIGGRLVRDEAVAVSAAGLQPVREIDLRNL